ncbi:MAG TPA: carboxypeptidase-like regulatory domain-containing protein, partial [Candidatus Hydrogenedentes bacterium]|nr:carboxypeptidase-like regulatory domain-containing protein [Candidatus Hydrogenedentota bacterium]
ATFSGIPWGYVWLYAERGNLRSSTTSTRLHARDNFQEVILKLESTAVIRGIVVNESGEPVAGADVVVSEKDLTRTSARTDSPDAEVTGEDGSFAFDTLPEGVYKFTAFADMYAPGESQPIATGSTTELVIRVTRGSTVSGLVRNRSTDAPISEFPLTAWKKGSSMRPKRIQSGGDGAFAFSGLAEGDYEIRGTHEHLVLVEGSLDITVPRAADINGIVIHASEGVGAKGRVITADDKSPVADVVVENYHQVNVGPLRASDPTDANGEFELQGLTPGVNYFRVRSDDISLQSPKITVELPESGVVEDITIELFELPVVRGIVRDQNGDPVSGATVHAVASSFNGGVLSEGSVSVKSSQDGSFTLSSVKWVAGQEIVLKASSRFGESSLVGPMIIAEEGLSDIELGITEVAAASIAGRVVNADGVPVFAKVQATPMGRKYAKTAEEVEHSRTSESRFRRGASTKTDINGNFLIMPLGPGDYDILLGEYVRSPFQSAPQLAGTVSVTAGQRIVGLEFVLDAGAGDIIGSVVDHAGRPLPGVFVGAQTEEMMENFERGYECRSDEFGNFCLMNLQEGQYIVRAIHPGFEGASENDVAPGEAVNFVLTPSN